MNLLPTLALFLFPTLQDGCGLEATALHDGDNAGMDMIEAPYVRVQGDLAAVLTVALDARIGFFRRQDSGWVNEGWQAAGSFSLFSTRNLAIDGGIVYAGDPWAWEAGGWSGTGLVQRFTHREGRWEVLEPMLPPEGVATFGREVFAENGRVVVAGSSSILVYRLENDGYVLEDEIEPGDGPAVVGPVAHSGDRILVGANSLFFPGAFVYRRQPSGAWTYEGELVMPTGSILGYYGREVAIDGDIAVVAAPSESYVHVFERSDRGWESTFTLEGDEEEFGGSIDLDGTSLAVGSPEAEGGGALYVFERQDDRTWKKTETLKTPEGHTPYGLGKSVTLDGTVVAGSHVDSGTPAFLYELGAGARTTGPGHPGFDGRTPRLDVVTCASDSEALSVSIEDGRPGALGVLWIGRTPAERQLFGATVHVGGPLLQLLPHTLVADPNGMGSATLRLTNRGALPPGFELHLQAAYMDADASRGVSLSNGLRIGD